MPRQPGLFPDDVPDESPLDAPWVRDALQDHSIATVVFAEVPWGPFDYLIPNELQDLVQAGRRVQVPLGRGNRQVTGYCVAVQHAGADQPDTKTLNEKGRSYKLKSITNVIDGFTLLSAEMLELTKWMADYYIARHGQVLEAAVPAGVRSAAGTRKVRFFKLNKPRLEMIQTDDLPSKQQRIVELLRGNDAWHTADQICKRVHCSQPPIQSMVKKVIEKTEQKQHKKTDIKKNI
ncbi:MAG: hypothetical protein VX761_09180, partial [Planctomycetota bacterium]|nr:hypothetical protein [Planctomycetota bacterium]